MEPIVLYAVKNQEGQWFRRKGYGGMGESWTDKFSAARVYQTIGGARGTVTWFAKHYPPTTASLSWSN